MPSDAHLRTLSVRFYGSGNAAEPVRQWLERLSGEDQRVVSEDILTAGFGWRLGMPHGRSIAPRRGLWELRSTLGGNRVGRVLICRQGDHLPLLHGFSRAANETSNEDLDLAVKRQQDIDVTGKRTSKHVGSTFASFLRKHGLYEGVSALAWKRVLAWQIAEAMGKGGISKTEMAQRMKTSRTQLERLLDPDNPSVLLETIEKAAAVVGKRLVVGLEDAPELHGKARSASKRPS